MVKFDIKYSGDVLTEETLSIIEKMKSGLPSEDVRPTFLDLEKRIYNEDKVGAIKGGGLGCGPMNMYSITRYARSNAPEKHGELTLSCNVWF